MASTLLIYAPVPVFRQGGALYLENQACNGLRLWAENFDRVLVMMPEEAGEMPPNWVALADAVPNLDRIEMHPLPTAYRPDQFAKTYRATRDRIRGLIERADYLSFAIGGLFGDWGAVACMQAHKMGRPYAVWTDRVESQVMRGDAASGSLKSRLKARAYWRPMAALERHVIKRAALGLFHGRDTFETYAPHCRNPVLVHDIHIAKQDHIPDEELAAKIAEVGEGPLRIVYTGRADAMKGPMDWIEALTALDAMGVEYTATWLGVGDYLEQMRTEVARRGLSNKISLPGFTKDRTELLNHLRRAHVFMFSHKTPESPRCLIEALISGTPIVGYGSAFPADLIGKHGGGQMTPLDDVAALADTLAKLSAARASLAKMIGNAAKDGAPYDDVSVFSHRSDVIKANL